MAGRSAVVTSIKACIVLSVFLAFSSCSSQGASLEHSHKFCVSPAVSNDSVSAVQELVPAAEGDRIELQCRLCSIKGKVTLLAEQLGPRMWYQRGTQEEDAWKEVQLGMEIPLTANRVYQTDQHTLVIKNFHMKLDSGYYECRGSAHHIPYFVDALQPSNVSVISGNESAFLEFTTRYMSPLEGPTLEKLSATPVTQWGPWGLCQECHAGDGGWRYRRGRCSLRVSESLLLPLKLNVVSCRSALLTRGVVTEDEEEVHAALLAVPDFELAEPCQCPAPMNAAEEPSGTTYDMTYFLSESENWEIKCPVKKSAVSIVEWWRNGHPLYHVLYPGGDCGFWCRCATLSVVQHSGSLLVTHAQSSVTANYSCRADGASWGFGLQTRAGSDACAFSVRGIVVVLLLVGLLMTTFCCYATRSLQQKQERDLLLYMDNSEATQHQAVRLVPQLEAERPAPQELASAGTTWTWRNVLQFAELQLVPDTQETDPVRRTQLWPPGPTPGSI